MLSAWALLIQLPSQTENFLATIYGLKWLGQSLLEILKLVKIHLDVPHQAWFFLLRVILFIARTWIFRSVQNPTCSLWACSGDCQAIGWLIEIEFALLFFVELDLIIDIFIRQIPKSQVTGLFWVSYEKIFSVQTPIKARECLPVVLSTLLNLYGIWVAKSGLLWAYLILWPVVHEIIVVSLALYFALNLIWDP